MGLILNQPPGIWFSQQQYHEDYLRLFLVVCPSSSLSSSPWPPSWCLPSPQAPLWLLVSLPSLPGSSSNISSLLLLSLPMLSSWPSLGSHLARRRRRSALLNSLIRFSSSPSHSSTASSAAYTGQSVYYISLFITKDYVQILITTFYNQWNIGKSLSKVI